ncbi:MAG: M20/M25/M40 family metallo-hydrolase [Nitrospirota bacterium]|nr:M20/M25/M40 family metallo-hydrolase [Nitrospirota bacterium]MDH5774903.1 M20/M25/M40 family metallo-hydrolase [Nitrospirota bacterium]
MNRLLKVVWQASLIGILGGALALGWHAMIQMPGESYQGPLPPATDEIRALEGELRSHVDMLAGEIGERNVFRYPQLVSAADYIEQTLSEAGYEVARQEYDVSGQACENIEAEVRGTERPDEIVLIGAHYDSVKGSPGANDNATGVAATLALARAFAQNPTPRTLRFVAFTNEEPPFFQTRHMGSRMYAKRSRQRDEHIILMLSLETIGYYSNESGSQSYVFPLHFFYPSTGNFIAFVSNVENGPLVRQLIGAFRRHTSFPSEGAALWGWLPGVGWSDHWAFWKEGFPAVMVTDTALFRDPTYHTSNDTPKNIHYEHFARVVSGLQRVITEFTQSPRAASH